MENPHRLSGPIDQVARILKGVNLDVPSEWTDEQIINRVYKHFGSAAICFPDRQWLAFVKSILRSEA